MKSKSEIIPLLRACIRTMPKKARQELIQLLRVFEESSANEFYGHNADRSAQIDWAFRGHAVWVKLCYRQYHAEFIEGSKGWKTARCTRKGWTIVDSHFIT